jgi:hypothetical protein
VSLPAILAEGRAQLIVVLCAFQTYGQAEARWGQRADGLVFGGGCSLFLAGIRNEAVLRRLELFGAPLRTPRDPERLPVHPGPLGTLLFWDVQRTVSENYGWVEAPGYPRR